MSTKRSRSPGGLEPPAKKARLQQEKKKTYTLGYDQKTPWHGRDVMLCRFRQKDLFLNGFISYLWDDPREEDFRVPATLIDPYLEKGETYADIHPIFQRSNWLGITDADYDLLKPALRLASCFLQEPSVFAWWRGLTHRPVEKLGDAKLTKKTGHDFLRVRLRNTPPTDPGALAESKSTWAYLKAMQSCVKLEFASPQDTGHAWAHTKNDTKIKQTSTGPQVYLECGLVGDSSETCTSIISLRSEYLEVLRGNVDPNDFPKARPHSQDELSTKTLFHLAIVMSHELCHAYWKATFATGKKPDDYEPYFEDQRVNELGSAFQSVVFGGDVSPLGYNSTYWDIASKTGATTAAPYGMRLCPWPGAIDVQASKASQMVQRATASYWGEENIFSYPVPIAYIHKFFTKKFWSQDVPRYGLAAYKPEVWLGITTSPDIVPYSPGEVAEGKSRDEVEPKPPIPTDDEIRARGFKIKQDWDADSDESDAEDLADIFSWSPTVRPGASAEGATVDPLDLHRGVSATAVSTGTPAVAAGTGTPAEAGTVTPATEVVTSTPAAEAGADDTADHSPVSEAGLHRPSLSIPGGAFTGIDWDEDDDLAMDDADDGDGGEDGGEGDDEEDEDEDGEDEEEDEDDQMADD